MPSWAQIETAFRDIFERKQFTNQGPLAQKLEAILEQQTGFKHVVCMTNHKIAEMIVEKAGGGYVSSLVEGAIVCTDDDSVAARLRNIRSSYGSGPHVTVPLTGNGRMSEAQAALALLELTPF